MPKKFHAGFPLHPPPLQRLCTGFLQADTVSLALLTLHRKPGGRSPLPGAAPLQRRPCGETLPPQAVISLGQVKFPHAGPRLP